MISLRSAGRFTVDKWLRAARTPFDTASRFLPDDRAPWNTVALLVDRADASARSAAADLLDDDVLRADADRRHAAVTERERAIQLRTQAADKKAAADDELTEDLERTAERRRNSQLAARDERERIAREASAEQERVEAAAAERVRVAEQRREQRLARQDKVAKRERLKVLDEQATALDQEDQALIATDEAQRLRTAASAAKAARKGST